MKRFAALLAGACLWADQYPRQPGVDVEHYVFRIAVSDLSNEICGEARVEFRAAGTREIALDFAQEMMVDGVVAGTAPAAYEHRGGRLRIALPGEEERRSVTVRYHGVPASGLWIGKNLHGDRAFFSLNWPDLARQWLPMIDHPYDKATSEFVVTAPAHYQVAANGLLQEETDLGDGRRLTHWKQSVPISSWLNAVAIARYSVRYFGTFRGITLSNWVYPQDREKGMTTFDTATRNAVEFFSDFIGPFPYEKLANVQAAGFSGGTEHASVIFYGEKAVTPKPATDLVTHEIAHQWFGNSVTENDWDDVWLSEGFATYFTLLCKEHIEGRDAFVAGLKRSRATVIGLTANLPEAPVIHANLAEMKKVLNGLIYQKGGWTLHMLRQRMGMDAFRAGVREYYARYKGGNATTADFQRVMEKHAGTELGWFFDQWLRRAGVPAIAGTWSYDEAGKQVRVRLQQTQGGPAYRLAVEIGLDGGRVERVELAEREREFVFGVERAPEGVRLDPETWLLAETTIKKQ
jgi:aminopeptidase N